MQEQDNSGDLSQRQADGKTSASASHGLNQSAWNESSVSNNKRAPIVLGWTMQQLSKAVCQIVESKGITSCYEVADEIKADLVAAKQKSEACVYELKDENIRKRVYDVLNVLAALDIVTRDRNEVRWKGLSNSNGKYMEDVKILHANLMDMTGKKAAYLKDIGDQIAGLESLVLRNQLLFEPECIPPTLPLPFILAQTRIDANVEIEISEDEQLVYFDFKSTPFVLHDDIDIVKLILHYQHPENKS